MPIFKLKIRGYAEDNISANWEIVTVDFFLSNLFSGIIDGFDITQWNIESITPSGDLTFKKNSIDMNIGDSFLLSEVENGEIQIEYFHINPSVIINLSARGPIADYNIKLNITSIV